MRPTIIDIIHMEANHLSTVVIFLVLYIQYPQILFQNLQNIQHKNIIFKTDLFLVEIW